MIFCSLTGAVCYPRVGPSGLRYSTTGPYWAFTEFVRALAALRLLGARSALAPASRALDFARPAVSRRSIGETIPVDRGRDAVGRRLLAAPQARCQGASRPCSRASSRRPSLLRVDGIARERTTSRRRVDGVWRPQQTEGRRRVAWYAEAAGVISRCGTAGDLNPAAKPRR